MFFQFDRDRSGVLEKNEAQQALSSLGKLAIHAVDYYTLLDYE